jgi:hypothetical protein
MNHGKLTLELLGSVEATELLIIECEDLVSFLRL